MITYEGERVTLNGGAPSLYTIGVSLGRIVRFCGHTRDWFSVLCHSLVVAELMDSEIAIHGLMHDAQESLVSDVPSPMKTQVARNREQVLLRNIYNAHQIPWPRSEEVIDAIEEVDHAVCAAEANVNGHAGVEAFWPDYDKEVGKAVKKWQGSAASYLNPETSGPIFELYFNRYYKLAGLHEVVW